MKKVFHIETTTDGKTLLYCCTGNKTNDIEIVEFPQPFREKKPDCDCEYEIKISDKGFCKKCEHEFYKKARGI